ncbi:SDR family oxidoreductase [Rothia nasisuis]|uniref:SDR family oxidoreductase n=1 Tax=Rothia nasisuis TaxID=2109647 RepID=UPI001F1A19AF|nr:NAD(P)-binding oxidoreductase [Rothia nasisuis]
MTILATGATGRIGRHLVTQLLDDGHQVRALTRNPTTTKLPNAAEVAQGDLTNIDSLRAAFSGIDALCT